MRIYRSPAQQTNQVHSGATQGGGNSPPVPPSVNAHSANQPGMLAEAGSPVQANTVGGALSAAGPTSTEPQFQAPAANNGMRSTMRMVPGTAVLLPAAPAAWTSTASTVVLPAAQFPHSHRRP